MTKGSRAKGWRVARSFLAVGVLAVGGMGLLHLPAARPLLSALGGVGKGACPVGRASAAEVEQGRLAAVHAMRGTETSPARPALGFELDRTTRAEVDAWASRHRIACKEKREGALLTCGRVPAEAVGESGGAIDEIAFGFTPRGGDDGGRLVNVTAWRMGLDRDAAAEAAGASAAFLEAKLGAPSVAAGDLVRGAEGRFATATIGYRYADYLADVTRTNMPEGVLLREHYVSAL